MVLLQSTCLKGTFRDRRLRLSDRKDPAPRCIFFLLAVVAVGVGNLFDNIDKHTAGVGASFIGFLWLPRIAAEHYFLHMTHTKNEIGLAIIYAICSFIILVKS